MRNWWRGVTWGIWWISGLLVFGRLRILEVDIISTMKTLSFWKPLYRKLGWAMSGVKALWMISIKFYFSPTETNLIVSFWYDYHHFRRVQPDKTIDDYLDFAGEGDQKEYSGPALLNQNEAAEWRSVTGVKNQKDPVDVCQLFGLALAEEGLSANGGGHP